MFKKSLVIILTLLALISISSIASADIFDEKSTLLKEYVTLLSGEWDFDGYWPTAKVWDGMSETIKLDAKSISIGGDNRIYCQWNNYDFKGNGGEILLTTDRKRIGIIFESNGITTVAYYRKR